MKILYLLLLSLLSCSVYAQDSGGLFIGESSGETHPKAILQLESSSKGLLITRVTTSQREAMKVDLDDAAEALMVYDKDLHQFYYWNMTDWKLIGNINDPDLFNGIDNISIVGKQLVVVRRDGVSESINITTENISEEGVNYFFNDFYKDQLEANTLGVKSNKDLIEGITDNNAAVLKNTSDISAHKDLIDKNTADILVNMGDIATHKDLTDKNTGDISAISGDLLVYKDLIDINIGDIAANKLLIDGVADNAAVLSAIAANTAQIADNKAIIDASFSLDAIKTNSDNILLNSTAISEKASKKAVDDNKSAIDNNGTFIRKNIENIKTINTLLDGKADTIMITNLRNTIATNMSNNMLSIESRFGSYAECKIDELLANNDASYLVNVTNESTEVATSRYHPTSYTNQFLYAKNQSTMYYSDGEKWIDLTKADKVEEKLNLVEAKLNNLITLIGNSSSIVEIKAGLSGL